jgi:nucleoside-diphosphate-sugar epimerase
MKIVITGSGGFIGQWLLKVLSDNKIVEYEHSNGFDVMHYKQLKNSCKGADAIIHLAALIDSNNPRTWEINVEGTRNAVMVAEELKIDNFILMSTTGVYGFTTKKVSESTKPNPEDWYERSKVEAEAIVLNSKIKNVGIVRSAMVLGPNHYWHSMFKLLRKKFPLPCKGTNSYQIVYVNELVNAIKIILEKNKGKNIYLIAGEEKTTLNDFCKLCLKQMGLPEKVNHIPTWLGLLLGKIFGLKVLTPLNIRHLEKERNYDISKIQKLGYKQTTSLEEAIAETMKELEDN